ncbi:hypothetical protein AUJ77_03305 [Candidatus Nomurabacteria bacterium CG1_02_43_90]|uniref:Aminoacyl-transfer RNA synthetases class-II family profile domain-containing protein n=1 Tax=Candidatus Nomurabacteria bacterium CG1_02_43_90 TaxID=1805281 RepID=A0A1J4V515_9BACT|nr:MAG: hypothetical protein AUJ77_03305 [Candidatus Nomurabacteria bacterium CG1_02_43_90]
MTKTYQTKEQVLEKAETILSKSLRGVASSEVVGVIESQIGVYGMKRKGFLGDIVEKYFFEINPFVGLPKKKKTVSPVDAVAIMEKHFASLGFTIVPPRNIANSDGRTDLVIAGVQMFDDIIHQNKEAREEKMFVAQPSVRMQFQSQVQSQEGTSTSFVNVCTEKMGSGFDAHLEAVDHWCGVLSKLGLHMNDLVIVMRTSEKDWGTGPFVALELFFIYGGLELGDAAYLLIPQASRGPLPVSDIGFGLERIVWAMNKTKSYFDVITPWTFNGAKEMFDSCRTLALLAISGVKASNKGPGLQFRRFAKTLSEKYYGEDIFQIVLHYFDYWGRFTKPSVSKVEALYAVRLEVERFVNL